MYTKTGYLSVPCFVTFDWIYSAQPSPGSILHQRCRICSAQPVPIKDRDKYADGGIRTLVPRRANAFRVRPVMTTSIRLQLLIPSDYKPITVYPSTYGSSKLVTSGSPFSISTISSLIYFLLNLTLHFRVDPPSVSFSHRR